MINSLIVFVTGLSCGLGLGVALWSFRDTAEKYYISRHEGPEGRHRPIDPPHRR